MKFTLSNTNKCKDLAVGDQKETILISPHNGCLLLQSESGEVLATLTLEAMENDDGNATPGSYFLSFIVKNGNSVDGDHAATGFFAEE